LLVGGFVTFDVTNFLISLAAALAADAAMTPGVDLFVGQGSEAAAQKGGATAFTVLLPYPGGAPDIFPGVERAYTVSVQARTTSVAKQEAGGAMAAQQAADRLHAACFDDLGDDAGGDLPRHLWRIAAKKLVDGAIAADTDGDYEVRSLICKQTPGVIGVDALGRALVVFNMEVRAARAS
jgi:hypothetical protein